MLTRTARLLRDLLPSCCGVLVLFVAEAKGAGLYFNDVFPKLEPGSASGWKSVNAFPNLSFVDPLWITELPGSSEMLVMVKGGQIWRFPNDPGATVVQRSLVLNIADRLQIAPEMGLLRMVFHPQFGQAGSPHANDVFLCYSHRPPGAAASNYDNMWRISRFQWQPATGTIDPASEQVLIQQYDPDGWHNAGILAFDNAGFLLISAGDGGAANDFHGLSQKLDLGLFGGILRIDVDNDPARSHPIRRQPLDLVDRKPAGYPPSFTQGYSIPNDNPWQDPGGGVLEEFHALGLRSPHSGHYDPVTGDLWVADVGQTRWEELNLIRREGNYGWPFLEGNHVVTTQRPNPTYGVVTPPVHTYSPVEGTSIIGGLRYRGTKWASELGGKILIGDNTKGTLSSVALRPAPSAPLKTQLVSGLGGSLFTGLANICTDSAGEVYLIVLNGVGLDGGRIMKLDKTGSTPQPPQLLSQTGLFTDLTGLQPHADLIPYTVANPLWSDGALKKRWIVTTASRPTAQATGNWTFQNGTVLVKHFEIPVDERYPHITRKLETRVMVQTSNGGKYGITYKWNTAGTDAVLLENGAEEDIPVTLADGSGTVKHWSYPSRSDCMSCHTPETGFAIGMRTHQLNLTIAHPETGLPVNQLSYLGSSVVNGSVSSFTDNLRSAPLDDESMPLEHRIRSYLDSNCSHCHRPDTGIGFFDARLETPLAAQNLIDAPLTGYFDMGPQGRYIKPGDALLSALHVRGASTTPGIAMPPLGKHEVDQQAMDLLRDYIEELVPEEFSSQPTPQARYLRLWAPQSGSVEVAELSVLDGRGFPIPSSTLKVGEVSGGMNSRDAVIDGDRTTKWGSSTSPHFITLDLGSVREVGGYVYTPNTSSFGRIVNFEIQLSSNGTDWTTAQTGTFPASSTAVRYDGFLKARAARTNLLAPASSRGVFPATLILDRNVTDLGLEDFVVAGGTASNLRGQGYFYTVDITPDVIDTASTVQVTLPENAVDPAGQGSKAASVTVESLDNLPPVATFGESSWSPVGLHAVEISFSEPVTGLEPEDFTVMTGRVISLTGSGAQYVATFQNDRPGQTPVIFRPAAFHDLSGVPNLQSDYYHVGTDQSWYEFSTSILTPISRSGFAYPHEYYGTYIPDERGEDISASPDYKIIYSFTLPFDGVYIFQADTQSYDTNSDSFYIGVDGGAPAVWNINRGPGEMGSGNFHRDVAGETTPYHYPLTAGTHTVEIYGREALATFRKPELVPLTAMPLWEIDYPMISNSDFTAYLSFTSPVTGLEISDFDVSGATVTALQGSGRIYEVGLRPTARKISLRLPANRVDQGNLASMEWRYIYTSPYEIWATDAGLGSGPADHLLDLDRDGIPQVLEYAFGMNPKKPAVHEPGDKVLPTFALSEENGTPKLTMQFNRRKEPGGIRYLPQFSGDGVTWEDATNPAVLLLDSGEWEKVGVTDHAGGSKRFGRVKVEAFGP